MSPPVTIFPFHTTDTPLPLILSAPSPFTSPSLSQYTIKNISLPTITTPPQLHNLPETRPQNITTKKDITYKKDITTKKHTNKKDIKLKNHIITKNHIATKYRIGYKLLPNQDQKRTSPSPETTYI
jgi:hypothetical protein